MRGNPETVSVLPGAGADPLELLQQWRADAQASTQPLPEAACLATTTVDGAPSARMVLIKKIDKRGIVFYTNRESRKGYELDNNPFAAVCIHWVTLGRQIRIEGLASSVSDDEANSYFSTRPRGSQIGAWASPQSKPLSGGIDELQRRVAEVEVRFADDEVLRPSFWIGYLIEPKRIEFWVHRDDRLHERLVFQKAGEQRWREITLAP